MGNDWSATAVVVAIALGCTVYYTATAWFAHRERMARIEKGLDPETAPAERTSD